MSFDFLGNFSLWGGGFTGSLLPFLFVLTIVVFFHELGHFLVARWCGVRVLVFSVGFGPELFGFNDRHGTRWKISAIPLGGYVKFFGDENAASVPDPAATAKMTAERKARKLPSSERREPRCDRRGWPDRQFHSGDRDLHGRVHGLRQAIDHGAGRCDSSRQRGGGRRVSSRATSLSTSMAARSRISPTCSASSASMPARQLQVTVERARQSRCAQGDAGVARNQGQFRQHASPGRARDQPVQCAR